MRYLDLNKSVYELSRLYPDFVDVIVSLGFAEFGDEATLRTIGKAVSLRDVAALKSIPEERVMKAFSDRDFSVTGIIV